VDKHFGDVVAEEQQDVVAGSTISGASGDRNLVGKVLDACEERFVREVERAREVPARVFGDDVVSGMPWAVGREEVAKWFRGAR
jgi:hypothetical protein